MVSPGPDGLPSASNAAALAAFRRGRLRSPSPLAGRGGMTNVHLPSDQDIGIDTFSGIDGGEGDGQPGEQLDHDERGSVQRPKWLSSSRLDQETINFYEYLQTRIEDDDDDDDDRKAGVCSSGVSFTSLLPPRSSSRIVATQALLHVLTLATNGALRVQQEVANKPRSVQDAGDIILMLGC